MEDKGVGNNRRTYRRLCMACKKVVFMVSLLRVVDIATGAPQLRGFTDIFVGSIVS